jgi:MFS family permease
VVGVITGIGGAIGILGGGLLIHRLGRTDARWQAWLVALATLFGTCASIGVYATHSRTAVTILLSLFVPVAYLNLAPILSLTQSLVLPRMRGLSCSLMLFGANVANLALAPQLIGVLSDGFMTYSPTWRRTSAPAWTLGQGAPLKTTPLRSRHRWMTGDLEGGIILFEHENVHKPRRPHYRPGLRCRPGVGVWASLGRVYEASVLWYPKNSISYDCGWLLTQSLAR